MLNARRFQGIQFGMLWETEEYTEKQKVYGDQPVLYYQFRTGEKALPIVPDGCVDILFCCDPARPYAKVCGTLLERLPIPLEPYCLFFGVRLSPALSAELAGLPMKEVVNVQPRIEYVLPGYKYLAEQIAEEPDFQARIRRFERESARLLIRESNRPTLIDQCWRIIERSGGTISIEELSRATGYSTRYLRAKFEETLGISPKLFIRIIRFQHTLSLIMNHGGEMELTSIASDRGFFDQAHLIKDFKSFSHLTPMQFLRQSQAHLERQRAVKLV